MGFPLSGRGGEEGECLRVGGSRAWTFFLGALRRSPLSCLDWPVASRQLLRMHDNGQAKGPLLAPCMIGSKYGDLGIGILGCCFT